MGGRARVGGKDKVEKRLGRVGLIHSPYVSLRRGRRVRFGVLLKNHNAWDMKVFWDCRDFIQSINGCGHIN